MKSESVKSFRLAPTNSTVNCPRVDAEGASADKSTSHNDSTDDCSLNTSTRRIIDGRNILKRELTSRRSKKTIFEEPKFEENLQKSLRLRIDQQNSSLTRIEEMEHDEVGKDDEAQKECSSVHDERKQETSGAASPLLSPPSTQEKYKPRLEANDDTMSTKNNNKKSRRKVKFSDVIIREYPIIVGMNPSVQDGPALTIDWTYVSSVVVNLEIYETSRGSNRRNELEMIMTPNYRRGVLERQGLPQKYIEASEHVSNRGHKNRQRSLHRIHKDSQDKKYERLQRSCRNVFTLGAKKRNETQYLRRAQAISAENEEKRLNSANFNT